VEHKVIAVDAFPRRDTGVCGRVRQPLVLLERRDVLWSLALIHVKCGGGEIVDWMARAIRDCDVRRHQPAIRMQCVDGIRGRRLRLTEQTS